MAPAAYISLRYNFNSFNRSGLIGRDNGTSSGCASSAALSGTWSVRVRLSLRMESAFTCHSLTWILKPTPIAYSYRFLCRAENIRPRITARGEDERIEKIHETEAGPPTQFCLSLLHHVSA